MDIVFEYPFWFLIFCILAGGIYALVLYYKDKRLSEISTLIVRVMAIFRFLAVTLLAILLLSPLLKTVTRETEKPVIIIAQDNSESLAAGKDSAFNKTEYKKKLQSLI